MKASRFSGWVVVLALSTCLVPIAWGHTATSASREIGLNKVAGVFVYGLTEQTPGRKHSTVPEGGSPLAYLGIAAVSCLGAIVARRQMRPRASV
jgi:hypothetical protein